MSISQKPIGNREENERHSPTDQGAGGLVKLWRTRVPEIWLPVSLKDMGYTCLGLEASSFPVSLFSS